MSVTRLSTQFRVREDIFDPITPNNVVQRDVSAPAGEWKPAAWLPIVFTKSNRDAGEDAFVISSGKIVAMDREGRIVPAGLRAALYNATVSTTVLTYTSTDYSYGVTDLTTGVAVASSSGASYTVLEVCEALIERGLVSMDETTTGTGVPTTAADCLEILNAFISKPVGVAAYDIFVWSGRPEDGDQVFTNYSKQHLVQFLTELQMKVPHRTTQSGSTLFDVSAITKTTAMSAAGDFPEPGATPAEVWAETALDDLPRYSATVDGMDVVALALSERPIAKNTDRTPITCDVSGLLTSEKSTLAGVTSEGDFWVDAEVGLVFVNVNSWDTIVTAGTDPTISFYYYEVSASTGASSDRYIFFDGEGKPGDFLSYDEHSNFVVMGSAQDALGASNTESIARLHKIDSEPKDYLAETKTAWGLSGLSALSKMPGSATKGYSDLITFATSEEVADQIAIITLKVN